MPSQTLHDQVLRAYILHLTLRDALIPPEDLPLTELLLRLQADMEMYRAIKNTRYLNTRTSIPKSGSLHLAWEYARRPEHHDLFIQMLCISPHTFAVLQELIKSHAVCCITAIQSESLAAQGIEGRPLLVLDWVRLS